MAKYKYTGSNPIAVTLNHDSAIILPDTETEISEEDYENISWNTNFTLVEEETTESVARKEPTRGKKWQQTIK